MTEEIYRRLCNIYLCMWFENLITDPQFDTLQVTLEKVWEQSRTGETAQDATSTASVNGVNSTSLS